MIQAALHKVAGPKMAGMNVTAGVAVSTPLWMREAQHGLTGYSEIASLLLPIAGLTWVLVQMYFAIKDHAKNDDA